MKNEDLLKSRRTFAIACPGIFFTLAFWSLALILGTGIYFLVSEPSKTISDSITTLISLTPFKSVVVQDTPQCSDGFRLLFTFDLPGLSESSCYRELTESPYIDIGAGWWKCKSGLFGKYIPFESTQTSSIWNLGEKFICVEEMILPIDDFYYSTSTTTTGLDDMSSIRILEVSNMF